jgi:hypothetical protein
LSIIAAADLTDAARKVVAAAAQGSRRGKAARAVA